MATRHGSATVELPSDTEILTCDHGRDAPGQRHHGPKVEVGDDVSTQDALVAFTGRDPGWRPPGAT